MKTYGLIGYPLSHSFSKKYFTEKFEKENIPEAQYELFEIENIEDFPTLLKRSAPLHGLNVTIPYKESVIRYLDRLSESAQRVGAVNVIKFDQSKGLVGYNSDYYGFLQSLSRELSVHKNLHSLEGYKAIVLGTGGASKAVQAALQELKIPFKLVSRSKRSADFLLYENLDQKVMREHQLIVNTTPLGMQPHVDTCPDIPYECLTKEHLLYDLVYNPLETKFMKEGKTRGAKVKNGLEMLHLQAERAWEIWNG